MSADVIETSCIQAAHCDGLAAVRIDQSSIARVNLYADQLETDGRITRVLVARLTMSRETMREVAAEMLKESLLQAVRDAASATDRLSSLN